MSENLRQRKSVSREGEKKTDDVREILLQTINPKGQERYLSADVAKRDAVVKAFKHAWSAYERDAMGNDNYHPISKKGTNLTDAGGIGYTVVDVLDTIQLMGLDPEYARARKWIANSLSFDRNDRLMPAFNTPFGLPTTEVNLAKRTLVEDPNNVVTTAEIASIQLEMRYLSHLTKNDEYWDKAENVMKIIKKAMLPTGLTSIFMGSESGQFLTSQIRLGSRGDSYYEYLLTFTSLKLELDLIIPQMYESTMAAIHKLLLKTSAEKNLTYAIELVPNVGRRGRVTWNSEHKQDHLVCFIGGSLILGATTSGATVSHVSVPPRDEELTENARRDWKTGMAFIETCMDLYQGTATGLAPEIVHFKRAGDKEQPKGSNGDWYINGARPANRKPPHDARYMLRPETIESLFLAYRLTGDEKYRQYGWNIFQSIEKYTRVETGGYATILNVDDVNSKLEDRMETFFLIRT
ncbi:hypothetical protein C0995_007698 [Termitomyces sp. Mi166|nr:hypothetical protein C0995_007698 [Termitomyces sp. Mi166\